MFLRVGYKKKYEKNNFFASLKSLKIWCWIWIRVRIHLSEVRIRVSGSAPKRHGSQTLLRTERKLKKEGLTVTCNRRGRCGIRTSWRWADCWGGSSRPPAPATSQISPGQQVINNRSHSINHIRWAINRLTPNLIKLRDQKILIPSSSTHINLQLMFHN